MEQEHRTILRQPPYFTMWALWFLVTAGYGVVLAAEIYIRGAGDTSLGYSTSLGGPLLGILQSLVLRHYCVTRDWWKWLFSSTIGWVVALVILTVLGGLVQMGGGLNPETDIRGCLVEICGLAGAVFGLSQALFSPVRLNPALWGITNAVAWGVGAFMGGILGFAFFGVNLPGEYVGYVYYYSPAYTLSVAIGVLGATLLAGVITGAGAVWQLRMYMKALTQ